MRALVACLPHALVLRIQLCEHTAPPTFKSTVLFADRDPLVLSVLLNAAGWGEDLTGTQCAVNMHFCGESAERS